MKHPPGLQQPSSSYMDAYLLQMKRRSDKLMDFFVFGLFVTGLLLSFVNNTWMAGLFLGGLCTATYYAARIAYRETNLYQYVLSLIFGIFMAQYIYQLHGVFEMHFISFIGSALLIFYQNWKLQLPLAIVSLAHHGILGYLYFQNKQVYFTQLDNVDFRTYFIHGLLDAAFFVISGILAYNFKKYSRRSINQTMQMAQLEEEKKQEKKLLATEKLLSEAQKLAKMGSWNVDLLKGEIFWSEGTRATYGVASDFKAGFDSFLNMVHPDDRDWVKAATMRAEGLGETIDYEFRIIRTNGEIRWLHGQNWYEKDENGQLIRISGISKDITEQKATEQKNRDLLENLQTKNKDLEMFAYMVSHNLRSPIAKILGMAEIFKKSPEFREKMTDHIYNEITNLDNVVKDMNTVVTARNSRNEQQEHIDLKYLLVLIEKVLEPEILESGGFVTHQFDEVDSLVTVRSFIYSIIYNLLSNAIKYRKNGVGPKIHISSSVSDGYICITVIDNGKGIDLSRYGDKLFGLYNRFHADDAPGRGIGLNLVKTQVDALGGYIEVESEVNAGTTFRVFLPERLPEALS